MCEPKQLRLDFPVRSWISLSYFYIYVLIILTSENARKCHLFGKLFFWFLFVWWMATYWSSFCSAERRECRMSSTPWADWWGMMYYWVNSGVFSTLPTLIEPSSPSFSSFLILFHFLFFMYLMPYVFFCIYVFFSALESCPFFPIFFIFLIFLYISFSL